MAVGKAGTPVGTARPASPRNIAYPALLIAQNRHRFYFTTIPIDDLFTYCFVSRRNEDPKSGFQRTLQEARASDIARYLADGDGSIPSNIVLSAQPAAGLRYSSATKTISFARVPSAFLVLDGQHRLWGYQKCTKRHRVPVAVYESLSNEEEVRLFIDINTTQRGVPAALLLDIKQLAKRESDRDARLRAIFDQLNAGADSPLAGKLSAAQSVAGKISRVTFNKAISPVLDSSVMESMDADGGFKLIVNYLKAVEAEFESKLLTRAAFFEAIFGLFDEVIRASIALHRAAKVEDIRVVLGPLGKVGLHGTGGRALRNKKDIQGALQTALRKTITISDDML